MRVAVLSGRVGATPPTDAAPALARAFRLRGGDRVQLAVLPMASTGSDLAEALAALDSPRRLVLGTDPERLGADLASALGTSGAPVLLDLTSLPPEPESTDAFLRGLGRPAPVEAQRGAELAAIVAADDRPARLLGVQGVAARAGFDAGRPRGDVLAQDAALAALATRFGLPDEPGSGAAGGVGSVVLALGGRLTTGFAEIAGVSRFAHTCAAADLVVVGTDTFTIGDFGGPFMVELAALVSDLGRPCLALARDVAIGTRELRRHGVEAILRLDVPPDADAAQITAAAEPAARTWLG